MDNKARDTLETLGAQDTKKLFSNSEELESQDNQAALKRIPKDSTAEVSCRDILQKHPAETAGETKESKRIQKDPKHYKRIQKIP